MNNTPHSNGDWKQLKWQHSDPYLIHKAFYKEGGYLTFKGVTYGEGAWFHFKAMVTALWPKFQWHRWSELLLKTYVENLEVGVMGPGSSGKTYCSAAFALASYYTWPTGTTVMMSSTTRNGLQLRVWGAIKELHRAAKERRKYLPGRVVDSGFRLTSLPENQDPGEGVDFRDGVIGIACKSGSTFVGLSNYVGLKNERVILIADEASLMERGFLDAIANLRKNPVFRLIAMGNPKDTTDALGCICEPHPSMGGWAGLDMKEETRTWQTRARNGIAVQLCGYDTPNADYPRGVNPYRGLITPEQIEADLEQYGRDSLQFAMMNLGIMPRDGAARRVITVSLCEQNMAFEEPVWHSTDRMVRVVGIDAAYSGVGGDRCPLIDLKFGADRDGNQIIAFAEPVTIVPVNIKLNQQPEEQIVEFAMEYCKSRGIPPENVGFDSTGRGTLMSAFARLWSPAVRAIEFGGKPTDRPVRFGSDQTEAEQYGKQVTALWYASRLVIEGRQMRSLPREVAEEGCLREWTTGKSGKIDVEPKDITKERMGRSPDLYDAFVVAVEVARKSGFVIAAGHRVGIVKRKTPSWLSKLSKRTSGTLASHRLEYS